MYYTARKKMKGKTKEEHDLVQTEISKKLDKLITLTAANLVGSDQLEKSQKIILLDLAGFTSKEIGSMLSMRDDSVRHVLSNMRRKKRR